MVSGWLVVEGVIFVRIDDVLLEVCPEPGEVVDLRSVFLYPLRILQLDGMIPLETVSAKPSITSNRSGSAFHWLLDPDPKP
jgi:hypothetical protein